MPTTWEVDTAVYEEKFKDISSEDTVPTGLFFSSDGTKMYIVGDTNNTVYQYTLSTPWNVLTATYAEKYKDVNSESSDPRGLFFKPDGAKMYLIDWDYRVCQYSLSTAWDLNTAVYEGEYRGIMDQDLSPHDVFFKPDGTKMYMVGTINDTIYQYSLSTAWEVDTATYEDKFKYVGDEETSPWGLFFKPDGTKIYIVGIINDRVFQYSLSTEWDISTAVYEEKSKYVGSEETHPYGIFFKPDGTKMYITGEVTDTVYQYDLPVGEIFYQSVGGSFGFTGSLKKLITKTLTGSLTFLGSIFLGRYLQATLSISCNESELSIYSNGSELSIYANESILSIEG